MCVCVHVPHGRIYGAKSCLSSLNSSTEFDLCACGRSRRILFLENCNGSVCGAHARVCVRAHEHALVSVCARAHGGVGFAFLT